MKKIIIVAISLVSYLSVFSQQDTYVVNPGDGNGINFWNSFEYRIAMGNAAEYHLSPTISSHSIKMFMNGTAGRGWVWGTKDQTPVAALSNTGIFQLKNSLYFNGTNSRVGIGTTNPEYNLDVVGIGKFSGSVRIGDYTSGFSTGLFLYDKYIAYNFDNSGLYGGMTYSTIENSTNTNSSRYFIMFNVANNNSYPIFTNRTPSGKIVFKTGTTNGGTEIERLVLEGGDGTQKVLFKNSILGIGTDYIPSGYVMAVNGSVIAERVSVDNFSSWPDYVFSNEYELKSLAEVENFVKENNHLPEVPSAKEVEENGVDLGEMDAVLLKKIEELTLYMIQLEKKNAELEKKVELLMKK